MLQSHVHMPLVFSFLNATILQTGIGTRWVLKEQQCTNYRSWQEILITLRMGIMRR